MSSTAITTVVTMLETLPEVLQIQVVEHLREYLADLQDEWQWDNSFQQTQASLSAASWFRSPKRSFVRDPDKATLWTLGFELMTIIP